MRFAPFVLVSLLLTQCTWSPVYDSRGTTDGTLSVKASDPVFACRLKNELLQRMKAMKLNERTIIRVEVDLTQGDLAYHPSHYAMRSQVGAHVTLTLDRPDQPVCTHSFTEVTAFSLDQNEGWLNAQSRDHAHERLLARVTDVLTLELASLTSSQTAANRHAPS